MDERHDFIVYVPQAFNHDPNRFFPVLYLHDGQNLFDPETSFIKGNYWRVGETADALIGSGEVEPLVIVGIYNAGAKRINEYTPLEDRRLGGGQGRRLRTDAGGRTEAVRRASLPYAGWGENCGMGGSSLGGLVTLYLGMRYPDVFGKLAVHSPSVWWRDRVILKMWSRFDRRRGSTFGWISGGQGTPRHAGRARAETDARQERLEAGQGPEYHEITGGHHSEYAWAERVGPMLKFLFSRRG